MDRTTLQVNLAHLAEPPVEIQLEVKAHPAPETLSAVAMAGSRLLFATHGN